jgi:adenylosuccinate lyase
MALNTLTSISPIDGRYHDKTKFLSKYFSEWGFIRYRVAMEVEYFIQLCKIPLPQLEGLLTDELKDSLRRIYLDFNLEEANKIKLIESETNHDVKAVEYYLKDKFKELKIDYFSEFIHFGLTSQDINNTAIPFLLKDAIGDITPIIKDIVSLLQQKSEEWVDVSMLSRTHGQPASPTRLGKEIYVFVERLQTQLKQLESIPYSAKFGGATGNFNAHTVAYPDIDWKNFSNNFLDSFGLKRSQHTTQIEHYDNMAALFDSFRRINTILIDMCRDIWSYVSMDYFKQSVVKGEVGSSAMPHKVNPIDFENAEGNLGMANAMFGHFSEKLPISRLQRDLTDSTVLRNLGVPFGHSVISYKSILKGFSKLVLNIDKIESDLESNWVVVSEAIQTILRRESYPNPYEKLKELTRGNSITKESISSFIDTLDVSDSIKNEMRKITPQNYVGI